MQYSLKRILKMNGPSRQLSFANSLPTIRSAPLFSIRSEWVNISLLIEMVVVTFAAILAIKVTGTISIFKQSWLMTPVILIAAALIPTVINKREFAGIGFSKKQIVHWLVPLGWACVTTFPLMVCGLWLMKYWGLELPLGAAIPPTQEWFRWLFYQFMYVAVAEEIFFRGYVQNNVLRIFDSIKKEWHTSIQWISIIISAACFAAAHTIVQGELNSVLTFLPGLVLGWLFVRTRSLIAPILFHGLANVSYLCIAAILA